MFDSFERVEACCHVRHEDLLLHWPIINSTSRSSGHHTSVYTRIEISTPAVANVKLFTMGTHRAAPTNKFEERRRARGSAGVAISRHNWEMSVVITERLGSFLNADLDPSVAASLGIWRSAFLEPRSSSEGVNYYHRRPKPLSLFDSSSGEKNIAIPPS